jgi:two-component system sensor kinase FixL
MIALPPEPRSGCPTVEAMSFEQQAAVLRAVFETAPDGLVTIDRAGLICAFNPAAERMFGYQSAEVIGRNVNCLMPPPFHAEHDGYIARYLRTGEKRIIGIGREVAAAKKDGTVFPIELAVGEVALGEQRLFAGFICDISERHAAERNLIELRNELLHVSRLSEMGEMASALAHELNQPLTAIINYLEASRRLLERQATPAGKAGELMAKASDQASRAGQIIQHLRRFIAKGETEKSPAAINPLVREAAELALIGVDRRRIRARFELADRLPAVQVDRVQIQQVVMNLVRNGIDALAARGSGEITLRTAKDGEDSVLVEVIDDGPGFAPEIETRLFQPFLTTKATGIGIGLSICKTIVDSHDGRLWASTAPDGGAAFHLRLPAADGDRI